MTSQPIIQYSDAAPKKKRWSEEEKKFLQANLGKLPLADIARELGRTEWAVKLFIHFNINTVCAQKPERKNLLKEMLAQKYPDLDTFKPSRKFYDSIPIGQVRFWQIYRGEKSLTEKEFRAFANYFGLDRKDMFELRQQKLLFDD